jgi:ubiquinone biosynthesis protein Coq4
MVGLVYEHQWPSRGIHMTRTTSKFREDFELACRTGVPPLESPPLAAAVLMAHAAFVQPERQIAIFDAIANAWLDLEKDSERAASLQQQLSWLTAPAVIEEWQTPRAVWDAFWSVVDAEPAAQSNAGAKDAALDFTGRVVVIGMQYDAELLTRCERAHYLHEDVRKLLAQPEVRMTTNDLRNWPKDSLGSNLLDMLTSKGYDLEVINPDDVMLPPVFAAQNRTNRRILQLHDVWHLFGGFGFTAQGEVAISGFQLAQFGQNYSTRFLAATTTMMCLRPVVHVDQYISLISEGWRHGRRAPPLMSVEWHKMLGRSIADLRAEMQVAPFKSRTPELLNF